MAIEVHGDVDPGYGAVADEFRRNFAERKELGAACAVVRDGRLVVDLWGGYRDKRRTKLWQYDTLVTVWSTTKGMSAAAMAVAHSRGLFDLEASVAEYWPEFAQAGKEAITCRQLLEHEAGLAVIDQPLDLRILGDPERLGNVLAAQRPSWTPGSARGYHAQSLGWYESQLIRRVDPGGRTIGRYFADEVAAPLGVEFYIGLPTSVPKDRVAIFVGGSKAGMALHFREVPFAVLRRMLNPRSMTFKAFTNPRAMTKLPDINKPGHLEIELPSVNGTGTARALATVYGDLATGGSKLGLKSETVAELERPQTPAPDLIFGIESAFRFGFMKPFPILPFGTSERAFGHTGSGGSFAYADPDSGVGYAYAMNRNGYGLPTDPREIALREALGSAIA
ncbi:MAG: beta-lactamase family protein [Acidimicrobiales bacterium]|nr:beta-lactamase family protein [Acidimicrobiales bacterium]